MGEILRLLLSLLRLPVLVHHAPVHLETAGVGVVELFSHRQAFEGKIGAGLQAPGIRRPDRFILFHLPQHPHGADASAGGQV
jgi:hypothetical protein